MKRIESIRHAKACDVLCSCSSFVIALVTPVPELNR